MSDAQQTILGVDDDLADCALLRAAFKDAQLPYALKLLQSGQALLDELRAQQSQGSLPRLILLDLNMPAMDGRQVLQHLQAEPALAGVPVVMLSTSEAEVDIEACLALGALSYLVKPFDYDNFVRLLRTLGQALQEGSALPRVLSES